MTDDGGLGRRAVRSRRFLGGKTLPSLPVTSGLILRYDFSNAASVTAPGGVISNVNDLSATGANGAPTGGGNTVTGPNYVLSSINGLNTARTIGGVSANVGLQVGATMAAIVGAATAVELFVIARLDADNTADPFGTGWGAANTLDFFQFSDNHTYAELCLSARQTGAAVGTGIMTNVFCWDVQSSNTPSFQIRVNDTVNFTSGATTFSPGAQNATLMCSTLNGFVMGGNLCELLLYGRLLSAGEFTSLRGYAKSKWGSQ